MKKKLLTLGTISVIAPVMTVVSCGINKYATDEEQKLYRDLTSETAIKVLENKWQYKVLTDDKSGSQDLVKKYEIAKIVNGKPSHTEKVEVYSPNMENDKVVAIAKGMIQKNINKDTKYLEKISVELLNSGVEKSEVLVPGLTNPDISENVYGKKWLTKNGLMSVPLFSGKWKYNKTSTTGGELNLKGLKLLASDDRLDFKSELLKNLMTYQYITNVNKEEWSKVHVKESSNLSTVDALIDPTDFILVKESLAKRYFAKWNIKLDKEKSRQFSTEELDKGLTTSDALSNLDISFISNKDKLVNLAGYKNQHAISTNNIYDFSWDKDIADYSTLVGYQGISNQAVGPDNLKFEMDNYKAAIDSSYWRGFLMSKKFAQYDKTKTGDENRDVKLFEEKGDTASLTFIKGIMPIFKDDVLKFDANKDVVTTFFAAYDNDLYAEAKKYYLTQVGEEGATDSKDAIILEFEDTPAVQNYKKILENKYNVDFLEAIDPE